MKEKHRSVGVAPQTWSYRKPSDRRLKCPLVDMSGALVGAIVVHVCRILTWISGVYMRDTQSIFSHSAADGCIGVDDRRMVSVIQYLFNGC